jgi:hypothetical protein
MAVSEFIVLRAFLASTPARFELRALLAAKPAPSGLAALEPMPLLESSPIP